MKNDRNRMISEMLRLKGKITVSELQKALGVSDMTVRRCLNEMASEGLLKRIHGGAAAMTRETSKVNFDERAMENLEYKTALAQAAVKYITPGSSVYLDGGTTCYQVARHIPDGVNCFIVTDGISVLKATRGRPGIETILLGGQLCDDNNTMDGPLAAENAAKLKVERCIISCGSFTSRYLQNNVLTSMLTKKIMLDNAGENICVCDAGKYNKTKFLQFCDWSQISVFITDSRLPKEAQDEIAAQNVKIELIDV